ncbi:hypothetical protein [Streptomyces neyagawaensis]|uniref:hypothetical protein n=1 Tax=Streptomyces neyagawaensis TaxID=42238 RepID=UPI0006E36760|nr:hypothetical protein [Streptomyces neyagawaensis]MCL6733322.1 hypothetical protein [Streptomyces neyagawaensis]MDE1685124.1 hypothetical protein [Streptomyces neyagawaensis]
MTTRLYAHASTAAAVLLTIAACYAAAIDAGWPAFGSLYMAVFFAWRARLCHTQARHECAVEQRLKRLKDGLAPAEPPSPCCSFWLHSDGEVHGPDCTRPAAARTTLTPEEEAAFAVLEAAFHRAGGAT